MAENKNLTFNPNNIGLKNGKFIGLPFEYEDAALVLQPVPWDVTVSFRDGTHRGPENILDASSQLDLFDPDAPDAWKKGIYMVPVSNSLKKSNTKARKWANLHINNLEKGISSTKESVRLCGKVNEKCKEMNSYVYDSCMSHLRNGKLIGLIGGDHSTPLGFYQALFDFYGSFGLLVIDAHLDLRNSYEGFTYSHASIFHNALHSITIEKLVQLGIRDYCDEELEAINNSEGLINPYFDYQLRNRKAKGDSWHSICEEILEKLPQKIVISVDIDGLLPYLCPNTGTPVPGGLEYNELIYLIKMLADSGKEILGFDVCEVAGLGHEWDGNVGARVIYKLAGQMLRLRENQ
jgi:agmatinase